jgi:hypothetical protein
MFRLLRGLLTCLCLVIIVWFAVTVPIGKHTLWGHLRRIAHTREAHDLTDGAKAAAKEAASRIEREVSDPKNDK